MPKNKKDTSKQNNQLKPAAWLFNTTLKNGAFYGLLFTFIFFLFDGLGASRVSGYFDQYAGSMSYHQFKITFKPVSSTPAESLNLKNLRFGYKLSNSKILNANILASEIPQQQIEYLFYDTSYFSTLSPDSIYAAWAGLRANYFSFLFKPKHAFEILNFNAYPIANTEVSPILENTGWKLNLRLYAIVSLLLIVLYCMAVYAIFKAEFAEKAARCVPVFFILLYGAAQFYISYTDFEFNGWPYLQIAAFAVLIGLYIYVIKATQKTEDTI